MVNIRNKYISLYYSLQHFIIFNSPKMQGMSKRRMIYCAISILLSLGALSVLWPYVGKDYRWFFIIAIILVVRLNIYIFTPRNGNTKA